MIFVTFVDYLKYIALAIVQGLAEILPISSSGHLALTQRLLGMEEAGLTLEIFLHFASFIAIIVYFRKRIWEIIRDFFLFIFARKKEVSEEVKEQRKINFFIAIYLVLATIPAAVVGFVLDDYIEAYSSSLLVIGISLFVTALMLLFCTRIPGKKSYKEMKWYNYLIIGGFQCLGIVPGISRSGSCLSGSHVAGMKREDAAEFIFFMGLPMILGGAILKVGDVAGTLKANTGLIAPYLISFIIAGVLTYFALMFFLKIIRKQKLWYFSIYCAVIGVLCIVLNFVL